MIYIAKRILREHALAEDAASESLEKLIRIAYKINDISCNKTKALIVFIVERTALNMLKKLNRINMHNDHIAFDFGDVGQLRGQEQDMLDFVPDGFEYISSQRLDTLSVFVYANEAGDRILLQQHAGMSLGVAVDNQNRDFTVRQLGDYEIYIFESSGDDYPHIILWAEGDNVFNMISTIDLNRMLDIVDDFISR